MTRTPPQPSATHRSGDRRCRPSRHSMRAPLRSCIHFKAREESSTNVQKVRKSVNDVNETYTPVPPPVTSATLPVRSESAPRLKLFALMGVGVMVLVLVLQSKSLFGWDALACGSQLLIPFHLPASSTSCGAYVRLPSRVKFQSQH